MQPSSLIFLVIVAIWAAYLIQHWVRRREHVATARSVDRFSEAMRVLERRSPLPSSELSATRPHSSASSMAAKVTARVGQQLSSRSPLTARSSGSSGSGATRVTPAVRAPRAPRSAAEIAVRKIRGVAFLVTLAAIPVTLLMSAIHLLPWVSVLISFLACVAVVAWLRSSALREQAARRKGAMRPPAPRTAPARPSGRDRPQQASISNVFDVHAPASPDAVAVAAQQLSTEVGRLDQSGQSDQSGQPVAPGGWSPVPVPLPTYALKNAAARALPEPADVTQTPVPIEVEDDDIERMAARHHRRVVGS